MGKTYMRPHTVAVIVVLFVFALQFGYAFAQDVPPAPAPVPPPQGEAAERKIPPVEVERDRDARIDALRQRWAELTALPTRTGSIQMVVQGEYIYILYGTYLCQLSAETLELKAKVDLRALIFGDRREQKERLRPERREKAEPEAPAEPAAQPAQQ